MTADTTGTVQTGQQPGTAALTIGAGATVLALIVTLITIRVRREDLPDSPLVM